MSLLLIFPSGRLKVHQCLMSACPRAYAGRLTTSKARADISPVVVNILSSSSSSSSSSFFTQRRFHGGSRERKAQRRGKLSRPGREQIRAKRAQLARERRDAAAVAVLSPPPDNRFIPAVLNPQDGRVRIWDEAARQREAVLAARARRRARVAEAEARFAGLGWGDRIVVVDLYNFVGSKPSVQDLHGILSSARKGRAVKIGVQDADKEDSKDGGIVGLWRLMQGRGGGGRRRRRRRKEMRKLGDLTTRVIKRLGHLAAVRGCEVLVMVEGEARNMEAPRGVGLIRARPVAGKDVGDDAIVEYVEGLLLEGGGGGGGGGVVPYRLVLVTADVALRERVALEVIKRAPEWLWRELDELGGELDDGALMFSGVEKKNGEGVGRAESRAIDAGTPVVRGGRERDGVSWALGVWANLRQLFPASYFATFITRVLRGPWGWATRGYLGAQDGRPQATVTKAWSHKKRHQAHKKHQ